MEKLGSKYGYWKVPSQKAIFKEDWGQNVILRIFGIKTKFWEFLGFKYKYKYGKKYKYEENE